MRWPKSNGDDSSYEDRVSTTEACRERPFISFSVLRVSVARPFCLFRRGDAPDFAAAVVGHQKGTVGCHRHADRAAVSFELGLVGDEAGEDVFHGTGRFAVRKGNESDFKADHLGAIPGSVHADKGAATVPFGKSFATVKSQTERRDMGSQSIIGLDRFGDQIGPLAFLTRVFMLAEIGKWPTVKSSLFYARKIVRDEIVAEQIALIDDRPEGFGLRFPIHADGVAQSVGKNSHTAAVGVDLQNSRPALILFPSIFFVDVRRGADRNVNLVTRWIGDQIAGVMAVDGQVENLDRKSVV